MSAPRPIHPGTTYHVTRRCTQGEYLLRPSALTNSIFLYVLAEAARRTGVLIHAFCVMSNHVHLVLTDVFGRLPEFQHFLDTLTARALNAVLGHSQSFWDNERYAAVVLATPQAVVDSVAYVLANPVAAGGVENGRDWPGLWSDPKLVGGAAIVVERPEVFFRKDGPMPASTSLKLEPPPGFEAEAFRNAVLELLATHEEQARAAVKASGRTFLGADRVLALPITTRAERPGPRGKLHPLIATRDPARLREELARLADFRARYRAAREAFVRGVRDVVFPAGTYWLRVFCGVRCEAAG